LLLSSDDDETLTPTLASQRSGSEISPAGSCTGTTPHDSSHSSDATDRLFDKGLARRRFLTFVISFDLPSVMIER